MCSCNKGKKSPAGWTVTFANGSTVDVRSEVAAKLKVGSNPGATYKAKVATA
jgi:hypothetical protein